LQTALFPWVYEASPAYFQQGLSPPEKPQSLAHAHAIRPAPVLHPDEWGAVAGKRQAGFHNSSNYGTAPGFGKGIGNGRISKEIKP